MYIYYVFIINLISLSSMGLDKYFSIRKKRRLSEVLLIIISLFAPFGSIIGMVIFRHKTSKLKFRILIPLFFLLQWIILVMSVF